MKLTEILQEELLNEMAAAKEPEKIAALIKKGDYAGAAKITVSASSGKPLGSVPANVKSLIDAEQVTEYRKALQASKPTSRKGPGQAAAQRKVQAKTEQAKTGRVTSAGGSRNRIPTNLQNTLRRTAEAIRGDEKLSDKDKAEHLEGLEILGQALEYTKKGVAVLGSNAKDPEAGAAKAKVIAKKKMTTDEKEKFETEQEKDKQFDQDVKDKFKELTGQDFDSALKKLEKSGAISYKDWKKQDEQEEELRKQKMDREIAKADGLKARIRGNSGIIK